MLLPMLSLQITCEAAGCIEATIAQLSFRVHWETSAACGLQSALAYVTGVTSCLIHCVMSCTLMGTVLQLAHGAVISNPREGLFRWLRTNYIRSNITSHNSKTVHQASKRPRECEKQAYRDYYYYYNTVETSVVVFLFCFFLFFLSLLFLRERDYSMNRTFVSINMSPASHFATARAARVGWYLCWWMCNTVQLSSHCPVFVWPRDPD